jgi:hypothetical protein
VCFFFFFFSAAAAAQLLLREIDKETERNRHGCCLYDRTNMIKRVGVEGDFYWQQLDFTREAQILWNCLF